MALTHNLDFGIFYVCLLGLFSSLALWYVPVIARVLFAAIATWAHELMSHHRHWFGGHHSQ